MASASRGGAGRFVFGDTAVQPEFEESFAGGQSLGVYLQLYNFRVNERTWRNAASIVARVAKDGHNVVTVSWTGEALHQNGDEITIQDMSTLKGLAAGQYHLRIDATDQISKQTVTRETDFTIAPDSK